MNELNKLWKKEYIIRENIVFKYTLTICLLVSGFFILNM